MKKNIALLTFFILIIVTFCSSMNYEKHDQRSILLKDSTAAIRVATAIFQNVYGDNILNERPFVAHQKNDSIWSISSTFKGSEKGKAVFGGSAYMEINKYTCGVSKIIKGK